jgi:glucosamine--fructose-6-phosphate aminotransferase (isomerizing)
MTTVTERTIFEQFSYLRKATLRSERADSKAALAFVGCGTSYNLALSLAASSNAHGIAAVAAPGHEWLRRPSAYLPDPTRVHVVAISRSGESTETVEAAKSSRAAGIPVTAITCEPASSLAKAGTSMLAAATHPDEGIVMTTSASLMLSLGLQFVGTVVTEDTIAHAEAVLTTLESAGTDFLKGRSHFVYLGGGPLYGIGVEGALKLQEMSCTVTQAYHPLEYRHGPVSVLDERSVVVLLYHPETRSEEERLAGELSAKGAFVVGLGGPGDLELPTESDGAVRGLVYLPALQLLGERLAGLRNLDTDAPRNLTKVVRIREPTGP